MREPFADTACRKVAEAISEPFGPLENASDALEPDAQESMLDDESGASAIARGAHTDLDVKGVQCCEPREVAHLPPHRGRPERNTDGRRDMHTIFSTDITDYHR